MAFLKNLSKSVGKAAEQAKFEADKLMRVNKLNSEVSDLTGEIEGATSSIGAKVMELYEAGSLEMPEIAELVAQVKSLSDQLGVKSAELEDARESKFGDPAPKSEPTEEAEPLSLDSSASTTASTTACPDCGAQVAEGAKFCPECGHKME